METQPLRSESFDETRTAPDHSDSKATLHEYLVRIPYKAKVKTPDPVHEDRFLADLYEQGYGESPTRVDIQCVILDPSRVVVANEEVIINLMPDDTGILIPDAGSKAFRVKCVDDLAKAENYVSVKKVDETDSVVGDAFDVEVVRETSTDEIFFVIKPENGTNEDAEYVQVAPQQAGTEFHVWQKKDASASPHANGWGPVRAI